MLLTHEARIESIQQNASKEAKLNYAANIAQNGLNKKYGGNNGGGYGNWNQNFNWNGNNGGGYGNWNQNVNWNGNNGGRGGYNNNNGEKSGFGRGFTSQGRGN